MAEQKVRNSALYTALRTYYAEVLRIWRSKYPTDEVLPRKVETKPHFEGSSLGSIQETKLNLLLLLDPHIFDPAHVSSYVAVEQAMRGDAKVARHLDTVVGPGGFRFRVNVESAVRAFLGHLLGDRNGLVFDDHRFEEIYVAAENFFYSDTLPLRFLAPLLNFKMETERIELGKGLSLLSMAAKEREEYLAQVNSMWPGMGPGWRGAGFGWEEFGLELLMDAPKEFGELTTTSALQSPLETATERIAEALSAFRLFKPGAMGYAMLRQIVTGWSPTGFTMYRWNEVPLGPQYTLSSSEVGQFRIFWDQYRQARSRDRPRIDLALRRLNFGVERIRPEDRLIDYVIGLEALLTGGDEGGDLSYRLAMRGTRLLGADASARSKIYAELRKGYRLRSVIVHGSAINQTVTIEGEGVAFTEFVDRIAAHLREAIKALMARAATVGEMQAIKSLDEKIVRGTPPNNGSHLV